MDSTYFETFGMSRPPFEETTSAEFFCANEACDRIMRAAKEQLSSGGVSLIKGASGCGKSILAQTMVARFKSDARVLSLSVPPQGIDADAQNSGGTDIGATSKRGIEQVAGEIVEIIADATDKKCAVIVDQAQHLSAEDLLSLQAHNKTANERGLKLSIILVGSDAIESTLRSEELKSITDSMKRLGELKALNSSETESYITNRLRVAGAKRSNKVIARKAIRRITELTGGVPRKINDLAKKTLHHAASQKETTVTAAMVVKCAAATNSNENMNESQTQNASRNENDSQVQDVPKMNQGKVQGVVKQLQDALTKTPETTKTPEPIGAARQGSHDNLPDVTDTLEELAESAGEADAKATKLNSAIHRAEETHNQLVDFADALSRIGSSTDERIELLLTSLESAQQIHEELQHIGDQAQGLIDESRNVVAEEHDKMLAQLDELTCRREELSNVIDQFKHEQEDSLRDARREVDEKIVIIRDEMDVASGESRRILSEAEHTLKRSERSLKETSNLGEQVEASLNDARHLEGKLAKTFAQIRQDLSTHRDNAAAATTAHEQCRQATIEARKIADETSATTQNFIDADERAKAQQSKLEGAIENAKTVSDEITNRSETIHDKIIHRAETLHDEITNRAETIHDEIRQAGEGIQERLAGGIKEVGRLTDEATDKINRAAFTIDEQMTDSVTAVKSAGDKANTTVRSSRDDAMASLQTTSQQIEARIADSIRRYEQLVAAEESAARRAEEASAHATSMMNRVSQSEAKLAETQQSILNIEALAAETLASVQSRLKTMQDSVNVIVDSGAARAKTMLDESLAAFQDEALGISESLRNSATDIHESMQTQAQRIQSNFDIKKQATQEIVEQFGVSIDDIAMGKITDTRDTVSLIATEATAMIEQQKIDLVKDIDAHAANCDVRMTELAQNQKDQIGRQIQEQSGIAITAIQNSTNKSTEGLKNLSLEIDKKSRAALVTVEDTAITTSEQAEKRVNGAALAAAKAIQDKIASATETVSILDQAIVSGNDMIAIADEKQQKINQLIQDVWSLTSTTDHRARSLEALSSKAKACEDNISSLVDQAATRITVLQEQNEAADQNGATLSTQHEQVESISTELAKQLSVAQSLHEELIDANSAGKQIEASMAAHAEEIQDLVTTADAIVKTIRDDDERAAQISASVKHSSGLAENVEQRLSELQQSLADPISTIQNARAQADELNELCLAVKRIFRGVSQASLDANERIKMMGKMLTASHKTAETMKQWVTEAEHSRERLEAAIRSTPTINDTHPPTMLPDAMDIAECLPSPVGANDLAAVAKMAQSKMTQSVSAEAPTKPAPANRGSVSSKAAPSKPKTIKFEGPEAMDAEERIEPASSVRRANQRSVATPQKTQPNQGSATEPASEPAKKRNRLSAEDVRSLIEAAKGKSAVG